MKIDLNTRRKADAEDFLDILVAEDDGFVEDAVAIEVEDEVYKSGDVCDLHHCTYNGQPSLIKIAKSSTDNDLVENEAALFPLQLKGAFKPYFPELRTSGIHEGKAFNVFPFYGDCYSVDQVIASYPDGLNYLDAVWVYKRMLVALGVAHGQEKVHGAVLPPHILINPENHGAKLIDWCYHVPLEGKNTGHIFAISKGHEDYYPPEVKERRPVHPTLDIFMATKVMLAMIGGNLKTNEMPDNVPLRFQDLLRGGLRQDFRQRHQSAWQLHEQVDKLLKELVGQIRYRKTPPIQG